MICKGWMDGKFSCIEQRRIIKCTDTNITVKNSIHSANRVVWRWIDKKWIIKAYTWMHISIHSYIGRHDPFLNVVLTCCMVGARASMSVGGVVVLYTSRLNQSPVLLLNSQWCKKARLKGVPGEKPVEGMDRTLWNSPVSDGLGSVLWWSSISQWVFHELTLLHLKNKWSTLVTMDC